MNERANINIPELNRLHSLLDFALEHFRSWISNDHANDSKGLKYLHASGLNQQTLDRFKVGYSLDCWDFLKKAGRKVEGNYSYHEMEKAGLLNYSSNKEGYYDVFRGRVMVPFLHHLTGQCIGFAGHSIANNKKTPKDLYPRDISLFKFKDKLSVLSKESFLFGLFQAAKEIKRLNEVYIAPNYMDVLKLSQLGITNTISSSGIPFTFKQAKLLRGYTENLVLVYTGENPGIRAALQHVDVFLAAGLKVKIVLLDGKLKADHDVEALKNALRNERMDYVLFKASNVLDGKDNDPAAIQSGIKSLVRTIGFIPDKILQDIYIKECVKKSGISIEAFRSELTKHNAKRQDEMNSQKSAGPKPGPLGEKSTDANSSVFSKLNEVQKQELELIRLLLRHNRKPFGGELFTDRVLKTLASIEIDITEPVLWTIASLTMQARAKGILPTIEYFQQQDSGMSNAVLEILSPSFSISELRPVQILSSNRISRVINDLKLTLLNAKLQELKEKMSDPDLNDNDKEKYERFQQSFHKAIKEHQNFKRLER